MLFLQVKCVHFFTVTHLLSFPYCKSNPCIHIHGKKPCNTQKVM